MTMHQIDVPIGSLVLSPQNARKNLESGQEDAEIHDLANSIAEQGLLQPLVVRKIAGEKYEVVAGQRRLTACKELQMSTVPCNALSNCTDESALSISLIENIQRADMHPLDKADGLQALYETHGSYARVAKETGLSPQTIKKYVSLNQLPLELKEHISSAETNIPVGPLFELSKTYSGDDAIQVYSKVEGFNANWQKEIIKRSGGDTDLIDGLIAEAHEGAFDLKRCDQRYGCQVIREIIAGEISDVEFEEMVAEAAAAQQTQLPTPNGQNPVHEFWKTLSRPIVE